MKLLLTVVSLLALVALPGWVVYENQDVEEISDADLRVRLLVLDAEKNAYTYLERATSELVWPEGAVAGSDLLDLNRYTLRHLVHVLGASVMQVPSPPEEADATPWVRIGELLAARALLRMNYGRQRLALADGLATARLGKKIEEARGALAVHARAGARIRELGLDALDEIVMRMNIQPGRARRLIRELEPLRGDRAARERMWTAEYQTLKATALEAFASSFADPESRAVGFGFLGRLAVRLAPNSYIFHPNRTFSELAGSFRALQGDAGIVCFQVSAADELATRYEYTGWRQLVGPNGLGQLYMALVALDYRDIEKSRCRLETRISLLKTRLAVQAYRAEQGKLPEGLGALVPNYLHSLPLDGFDGRRLRYSRSRGELWSLGDESLSVTF